MRPPTALVALRPFTKFEALQATELQLEFPRVDMVAVIEFEPHVIQRALPARVRALKSIKPCDRSASLRAFYPPRVDDPPSFEPMKNAQLFAKVFLLTTECSFPRGDV